MVIVDSCVWISLLRIEDIHHQKAVEAIQFFYKI